MAVEDPVSAWAAMTSWLTLPFLFVFLNLTIGTIAVVSSAARRRQHRQHPPPPVRTPSLLDRVRSFNFSQHATELADPSPPDSAFHPHANECTQLAPAPSLVQRLGSLDFSRYEPELVDPSPPDSAVPPDAGESTQLARAPPLVERLRSFNFSFKRYSSHLEPTIRLADPAGERESTDGGEVKAEAEKTGEATVKQVPETVRESSSGRVAEDDGVDARADAFINRFSQQLKLQRLKSFLRYSEMINRGSGPSGQ